MANNDLLSQHLNSKRFMGLLPLINFLRQLAGDHHWQGPPSRACFIFDDPSLYFGSYGFLNFRDLAAHATKHSYFVSIATVPLDTWGVSKKVARTFRACNPRLSVLIHGNNHTTYEMLSPNNGKSHLASAAQAMRRMQKLEQKHGLPFVRVMEAPHGALASNMFQHLLDLGYEAALCTPDLLVRHNPGAHWPATFGMHRSEMIGGLPVIPRIKMSSYWKNDVLLRTFLQQPIIVAGHHSDAAHELRLLEEIATTLNSIGGIVWSDLEGVLETNYLQRRFGDILAVKLYSRRIKLIIPSGVRYLSVERPWIQPGNTETLNIAFGGKPVLKQKAGRSSQRFPLHGSESVEIDSPVPNPLCPGDVAPPAATPWPLLRKVAMEIRDRLSPVFPFIDKLRRPADAEPKPTSVSS